MKIIEAIKFIVDRKDDNLLKDSKKFNAYLKDLCADNPKELKIINRALEDKILERIFGNERDNVKIARLRDEFENQGLSTNWSEFIISSFAKVLGWNYEPKETNANDTNSQEPTQQITNKPQHKNNTSTIINYIEVALTTEVLKELGYWCNKNIYREIIVPPTYTYNGKNYKITKIGDSVLYDCSSLRSIEIPNSVTEIGDSAFLHCESLKEITIPNSVTKIGKDAFAYCNIKCIELPDSIIEIGRCAFRGDSLESIKIPNGITRLYDWAFFGCSSLNNIKLSKNLISIEERAFGGCSSLKSIEIPDSVKIIERLAFWNCSSLNNITIPDSVTKIEEYAFENCNALNNITIPNSVTKIGKDAFLGIDTVYYNGSAEGSPWGAKHHIKI